MFISCHCQNTLANPRGQCCCNTIKELDYVKLSATFFIESIPLTPKGLCKVTFPEFIFLELLNKKKKKVYLKVVLAMFSTHAMKSSMIKLILTWNLSRQFIWYCYYYWSFFGSFRMGFITLKYLLLIWLFQPLQCSISAPKRIKLGYAQDL